MKKAIDVSVYLVVLLMLYSFTCIACRKEKPVEPITPVTDTVPKKDSMPVTDTIPPATMDTTKVVDTAVTPAKEIKFLALGDSYTIGQSVKEDVRFPAQTVQMLRPENIFVTDLKYIAQTGWTTANLASAIAVQKPATNFDIVTLLIGVNNQYQGRDQTEYAKQFEELLKHAIVFAGNRKTHVFVLSIPDYSATPFVGSAEKATVSKEIDDFNAINKKITLQYNIAYIDITPSTRQAVSDASLIAYDSLHPSGKEYRKWAEMLAPAIKAVLK
ncbi:MAG TPA: SGNH/GDSL hydrolase family protein [Segetibacter sp.]|jgi:lysophospholipase L1-like esterase